MDTAETQVSRDFFISYTGVDREWAEWIAWQLEESGYTTILQAWDFGPGTRFVTEMHHASQVAGRTIAILSSAYLESSYAEAEWQEAWRNDPTGRQRKLLVFRIEDCPRPGLLGQIVSDDLFGIDQEMARSRLLAAVREGRKKPALPPGFPVQEPPSQEPRFPGRLVSAPLDAALAAGGPMTPDNPFAVAVAFWYAVMQEDPEGLSFVATPESFGQWDLADANRRTEHSGLATGVYKPCYDVAYIKMVSDVDGAPDAAQVVDGSMLIGARVLSLVYRPELGGWRVHGMGHPVDPAGLPRTWKPES